MNRRKSIQITYNPDLLTHEEARELVSYLLINQIDFQYDAKVKRHKIYLNPDPEKALHGKRIWHPDFRKCFTNVDNRMKGGGYTGLYKREGGEYTELRFPEIDEQTTTSDFDAENILYAGIKYYEQTGPPF